MTCCLVDRTLIDCIDYQKVKGCFLYWFDGMFLGFNIPNVHHGTANCYTLRMNSIYFIVTSAYGNPLCCLSLFDVDGFYCIPIMIYDRIYYLQVWIWSMASHLLSQACIRMYEALQKYKLSFTKLQKLTIFLSLGGISISYNFASCFNFSSSACLISSMHSSLTFAFFWNSLFWSPSQTLIFSDIIPSPSPSSATSASNLASIRSLSGYLFLLCTSIGAIGNSERMHSMAVARSWSPPSQFLLCNKIDVECRDETISSSVRYSYALCWSMMIIISQNQVPMKLLTWRTMKERVDMIVEKRVEARARGDAWTTENEIMPKAKDDDDDEWKMEWGF